MRDPTPGARRKNAERGTKLNGAKGRVFCHELGIAEVAAVKGPQTDEMLDCKTGPRCPDVAVVLSMREYERLIRLNISEFQQFRDKVGAGAKAAGMTEEKFTELLADD